MWRHYVYIHFKASDGQPFYVGKGAMRKRDKIDTYYRACEDHFTNKHWQRIVDKYGIVINIIASCINDLEAQRLEKEIIAIIGRADLGNGPLVNKTDGGEGSWGFIPSEETRRKRSIASSGPRSEAFKIAIRKARKNGGNGGVVKLGDKLSEEWRKNLAKGKLGDKNPWFGIPSPPSKKVKNTHTGAIYDSIYRAAKAENINPKTLYQYLDGTRRNKSPLVRI